ncbi:MAG: hypothetical protein PHQ11_03415 [Paludibacter sp.]|nr:hypothetical protein [Paludibacter sp.]MDD4199740.1 hypothetical protein [Paludibacter sp.]MDD4429320.1 hypothetical protein [Paludibacter sp.]
MSPKEKARLEIDKKLEVDFSLAELMTMMEDKSQNILSAVNSLKKIIGNIEAN